MRRGAGARTSELLHLCAAFSRMRSSAHSDRPQRGSDICCAVRHAALVALQGHVVKGSAFGKVFRSCRILCVVVLSCGHFRRQSSGAVPAVGVADTGRRRQRHKTLHSSYLALGSRRTPCALRPRDGTKLIRHIMHDVDPSHQVPPVTHHTAHTHDTSQRVTCDQSCA